MSTALSSGEPSRSFSMRAQLGDEALVDGFLHEQPRARAAHLALVEPDRVDHAFDHAVQVGVVVDDERALAAQLEGKLLARARGGLADDAADLGRAGESDLVDAGMIDDGRARLAVAVHEVHDARRQADLVHDLGERHRGERRELGGLEHQRVAARERRRDLPREHEQGEIPRDDLADHADRLVAGELGPSNCAQPAW